ncbi:hypothetical protein B9Z19DRAFT_1068580 [Tuber borchii]|uniref:Uncharacterized protein n=1 Tax=Tuber borchii TaxID=42251 RepID=A0A2T6ZEQ7_TUBBO|nr:hypothetical protein B9Z19DRAFT_1068580 [Tuber borchii]
MILRRLSEEAGLDEPADTTTLAAFATRQSRTEFVLQRRRLIGGEGRVKELMRVNDEMGRGEEPMKGKVGALEGEKEAIKLSVTETEEKAKKLSEELKALKVKLIETERSNRQLIFYKG